MFVQVAIYPSDVDRVGCVTVAAMGITISDSKGRS